MANPLSPIDYTSKDYDGFRQQMLDHAARTFPDWTGRNAGDFGVLLIEAFATMGDILSYYGDRIANEAYIGTATQRASVLALAELLGYRPHAMIPSDGTVTLQTATGIQKAVVVPAGTRFVTNIIEGLDAPLKFESTTDVSLNPGALTAVPVTQGETIGDERVTLYQGTPAEVQVPVEVLATSTGEIDQEFTPLRSPVLDGSVRIFVDAIDAAGVQIVREWRFQEELIDADANDEVFTVSYTDTGSVVVRFGDNVSGKVPGQGLRVYANYRIGNGAGGNVVANAVVDFETAVAGVEFLSSSEMSGGYDAEATDQIRTNAPRMFTTQRRAVTLRDYENAALAVSQVSQAKAVARTMSNINVFIMGANLSSPTPDLLEDVRAYLQQYAMVGATVTVAAGSTVGINVGSAANPLRLGVLSTYAPYQVVLNVKKALLDALASDQVTFGQRVSVGSIFSTIMKVPGVDYVNIPVFARATDPQSTAQDVLCRAWEIPFINDINVIAEGGLV